MKAEPWDEASIGLNWSANLFGAFLWLLLGSVLGTAALGLILPTAQAIDESRWERGDEVVLLVFGLLSIVVCAGTWYAFRNAVRAFERARARDLNKRFSVFNEWSYVVFVPKGVICSLEGYGKIAFSDSAFTFSGPCQLRESYWGFIFILSPLLGSALHGDLAKRPVFSSVVVVLIAGILIAFVAFRYRVRSRLQSVSPLRIESSQVRRVRCLGPFITISLRCPPVPGLFKVYFFVASNGRREFFAEFEKTFPGKLPPKYRKAIELSEKRCLAREQSC